MGNKYELIRIYVWFNALENSWAAEGKWWKEDEVGTRYLQGTIGHAFFMDQKLTDAIDEILRTAADLNIAIRESIRLDYSEKYEYWTETDYEEPNPFPKPVNFEELINIERTKRKWAGIDPSQ
ncbi:hypothetical protein [Paenibacillus taichungensis]